MLTRLGGSKPTSNPNNNKFNNKNNDKGKSNSPSGSIPRQYSNPKSGGPAPVKANTVDVQDEGETTDHGSDEASSDQSVSSEVSEAQENMIDFVKALQTLANMTNTTNIIADAAKALNVNATWSYIYALAGITMEKGHGICAMDGAANAGVLGDGFKLLAKPTPERLANILGFHQDFAKRNGCLIGTFGTVTQDINSRDILLIYNEGVQNKGCNTSLAAEFQIRHYGHMVDSTSKKHTGVDGKPGTQCAILQPDEEED